MNRRLFDFLIVNVVFNHSFRFIAYASNKVGKTPEIRLPIILSQLRTEGFPDLPWWSRFKCVNKLRKIELRICVKQYMHMIRHCFNRLHTKFMIFKVSARIIFQKILEFSRYCRFSVFCNQYNNKPYQEYHECRGRHEHNDYAKPCGDTLAAFELQQYWPGMSDDGHDSTQYHH